MLHTAIQPEAPATWADLPEAAELLASCAVNPPARKHHVDTYAITADHWSEYSRRDPRVARLWRLWDEAFEAAVAAGHDGGDVLRLTPEQAIRAALRPLSTTARQAA